MQIQTVSALANALSLTSLKAAPQTPAKDGVTVTITIGNRVEVDDFIHLSRCTRNGEIVLRDYHPSLRVPLCTLYQNGGKISAVDTDNDGNLVIEIFMSKASL